MHISNTPSVQCTRDWIHFSSICCVHLFLWPYFSIGIMRGALLLCSRPLMWVLDIAERLSGLALIHRQTKKQDLLAISWPWKWYLKFTSIYSHSMQNLLFQGWTPVFRPAPNKAGHHMVKTQFCLLCNFFSILSLFIHSPNPKPKSEPFVSHRLEFYTDNVKRIVLQPPFTALWSHFTLKMD